MMKLSIYDLQSYSELRSELESIIIWLKVDHCSFYATFTSFFQAFF